MGNKILIHLDVRKPSSTISFKSDMEQALFHFFKENLKHTRNGSNLSQNFDTLSMYNIFRRDSFCTSIHVTLEVIP